MLVVMSLLFAAPAAATHVQCGDVITEDTVLDSDLTCGGTGLIVAADDVTLDLAGHTIAGPGSAEVGISVVLSEAIPAADRARIQNGTIRNFGRAIDADGPRGTSLRGVVLAHNGAGLHCQYAPECRIEDSVVHDNGAGIQINAADGGSPAPMIVRHNWIHGNGVGVSITGDAAVVTDNRIQDNVSDGIRNQYGLPVSIRGNVLSGNGGDAANLFFGADATVADNRIVRNAGNGVAVHGGGGQYATTQALVARNLIRRNGGDGVLVEGKGVTATVDGNRADRNGDDGIDVDFGTSPPDLDCCFEVTVRANVAFSNDDLGIEAVQGTRTGTTDGGGNKAKHNGNPLQCIGVSCK